MEINRHHMTPVSRGGKNLPYNRLRIKIERHKALHRLYGQLTWIEISRYLSLLEMSGRGRAHRKCKDYKKLWGKKTLKQVFNLMGRIYNMKQSRCLRSNCSSRDASSHSLVISSLLTSRN